VHDNTPRRGQRKRKVHHSVHRAQTTQRRGQAPAPILPATTLAAIEALRIIGLQVHPLPMGAAHTCLTPECPGTCAVLGESWRCPECGETGHTEVLRRWACAVAAVGVMRTEVLARDAVAAEARSVAPSLARWAAVQRDAQAAALRLRHHTDAPEPDDAP
jgi:hypothetical protein